MSRFSPAATAEVRDVWRNNCGPNVAYISGKPNSGRAQLKADLCGNTLAASSQGAALGLLLGRIRALQLMGMETPVTNIVFGTMTLGYHGYGSRVHDLPTAEGMLETFASFGHHELDTASAYGDGSCEEMLADLQAPSRFSIATRFDPITVQHGHEPELLTNAVKASFNRLKIQRAHILYLSARDTQTPLERTLRAVQELYEGGLFDQFGLSNFGVSDIEEVIRLADEHAWVRPAVYQGPYNAVARSVEAELLPMLRSHGIRFNAFNPLAGGAFAPSFGEEQSVVSGSRFDESHRQGRSYRQRYWNDMYLAALNRLRAKCDQEGLSPIAAALRWLIHHSSLDGAYADGVILGASSERHLRENLEAVHAGPLPETVVNALGEAAEATQPNWPGYSVRL